MHHQTSFGHDALGRFLEERLRRAQEWALDKLTGEGADLDALVAEAGRTFGVAVPGILHDGLWVEFKPAGNGRNVRHSENDCVLIHVPHFGTAELISLDDGHGGPRVTGGELVVSEPRQLTYFPERALNADGARAEGEALKARALQAAEARIARVAAGAGEIARYNAALEAALRQQRAKVENVRRYRAELEAGIGLPTSRPGGGEASR